MNSDGSLAGYSGTPLPRKLGIKAGSLVVLVGAPRDFKDTLGELPPEARLTGHGTRARDLTIWFVRSIRALQGLRRVVKAMGDTPVWIAWPKKSGPLASDVGEVDVRGAGLAIGLVDYKVCAIDAAWSGLLFRRRKSSGGGLNQRRV